MSTTLTQMLREIHEIPSVAMRQIVEGMPIYREEGLRLRRENPHFLATCARGSSDQAVTYLKYLVETRLGIPVASVGPSVASVYGSKLKFDSGVLLTVSQSGGSPDLVSLQQRASEGGARTLALLNVTNSVVGKAVDSVLPMLAGPEAAVAATKSFVASLIALASVVAHWNDDRKLVEGIQALPDVLSKALDCDWDAAAIPVAASHSLYTIGRGPGLGIAGEAALKFKETCRLHVEAYSAAEVRHGLISLARDRFAALVFVNGDEADTSVFDAAERLRAAGARTFVIGTETNLPAATPPHPVLNPILQIVTFYRFVESLSVSLGENPDAPKLLRKVTETV